MIHFWKQNRHMLSLLGSYICIENYVSVVGVYEGKSTVLNIYSLAFGGFQGFMCWYRVQ